MIKALVQGVLLGLLLAISVGPVIFAIIKQSINNGHKGGISFILGVSASDITLVVLANAFTEIFDSIKKYSDEIGIAGSAMLLVIGVYFLFFKKVNTADGTVQLAAFRKRDYAKIFISGFFMNVLNPAVLLFWFTATTAFFRYSLTDRIVIFSTCLGVVLTTDFMKVFLANRIRTRLTPHNIHLINRISGLILLGFGVVLLWGVLFLKPLHNP